MKNIFLTAFLTLVSTALSAWTIEANFNDGQIGTKADGDSGSGFHGAAGLSRYSTDQRLKGIAARTGILAGSTGYGSWGGEFLFPEKAVRGDTLYFIVHTYFPQGFDYYSYDKGNRLKFLRISTKSESGSNHGFNDLYVNVKGDATPFLWIYEGEAKWARVGDTGDLFQFDTWESYQMALVLDSTSKDEGGMAEVWIWKDDELLSHITNRKTLKAADDYSDRALLFTYWNGGAPKTQYMFVDEIKITTEIPTSTDSNGIPYLQPVTLQKPRLQGVLFQQAQ